MRILQIVFCILACVSVLAVVPVGIWCDLVYITVPLASAVACGALMVFFKKKADPPPPPKKDFMDE